MKTILIRVNVLKKQKYKRMGVIKMTDEENFNKIFLEETGARLKAVRRSKNITQKEAAKALGVTQSCLSSVEAGKKLFSTALVVKLIKYYNVPYEIIFGESVKKQARANPMKKMSAEDVDELSKCIELLILLIENGKSYELMQEVKIYIKISVYIILRELYSLNPHNSNAIFGISEEEAMEASKKFVDLTRSQVKEYAVKCKINKKNLEIPIEKNFVLREFIKECELYLINS